MSTISPYEYLGLARNCRDPIQIRRAFNVKVKVLHPDKQGDTKEFMRLKKCYDHVMKRASLVQQEELRNNQTPTQRLAEYTSTKDDFVVVARPMTSKEPWKNEITLDNSVISMPSTEPIQPTKLKGDMTVWKEPVAYDPSEFGAELISTGDILFVKDTSRPIDFEGTIQVEQAEYQRNSCGNSALDAKRFLQTETVTPMASVPKSALVQETLTPTFYQNYDDSARDMHYQLLERELDEKEAARSAIENNLSKYSVEIQNLLNQHLSIQ